MNLGVGASLPPNCDVLCLEGSLDGLGICLCLLSEGQMNLRVTYRHGLLKRMGLIFSLGATITFLLMQNDWHYI
jgi:hypothetical protein